MRDLQSIKVKGIKMNINNNRACREDAKKNDFFIRERENSNRECWYSRVRAPNETKLGR